MKNNFTDLSALEANRFKTQNEKFEHIKLTFFKRILICSSVMALLMLGWLTYVVIKL